MTTETFGSRVLSFYRSLRPPRALPRGVDVLSPYRTSAVRACMERFYTAFFSDARERVFVLGINPGRFGAGVTGITFTDPVALEAYCGIANPLPKRRELSSRFLYDFIEEYGGASAFHESFFLTAVCPIGFTRGGLNLNYYDEPALMAAVRPYIIRTLRRQLVFGARRGTAIVLGNGRNHAFLAALNAQHRFFHEIIPLEHPRFIMQYRRKRMGEYLKRYDEAFRRVLEGS
jgi:Uracil DNA glycosylase superfamily